MQDEKIKQFIATIVQINHTLAEIFDKGDLALFLDLHAACKKLRLIEKDSQEPAIAALCEDCNVIYRNCDMIVAVVRSTENGVLDSGAQTAINSFLHNIDRACISIASALKIV